MYHKRLVDKGYALERGIKVIDESKKVREIQPKIQAIFNEADSYANSYKSLEKEN